jgi:hypothetical protein
MTSDRFMTTAENETGLQLLGKTRNEIASESYVGIDGSTVLPSHDLYGSIIFTVRLLRFAS